MAEMSDSGSVAPTTLITGLKAASAAKAAAQGTPTLVKKGLRQLRLLGTFEPSWLELVDENSDKASDFTAKQIADVHRFLASGQVSPILTMLTLIRLSPSGAEKDQALKVVEIAFKNETSKWNADSKSPWRKQVGSLWNRINSMYESTLPESRVASQLSAEIENFSAFVQSPLQMPRMGTL